MSVVVEGEESRRLLEAAVSQGLTPNELTGGRAVQLRQQVELEAGLVLVADPVWRLVLDELDRAMVRALRGSGVRKETRCRSCEAPVRWVTTTAGRRLSLDPLPHPRGNVTRAPGSKDVVDVHPRDALPLPGVAFRPHFATCPQADAHRKPSRVQPRCPVCRCAMHPKLVELGARTHPCCDPGEVTQ